MSLIRTTAGLDKLAKGIDAKFLEVFDENVDNYQSDLKTLFRTRSSDKKREHTKNKAGTGLLSEKDEGSSITRGEQKLAYETEFLHNTFGKGVTVTMEDIQDRDYADKLDEFKDLSRSAKVTMDRAMAQVFNSAFNTTTRVNGQKISRLKDAVPLCSTVHPLYGSSDTQSNASSTGIKLSDTNLEVARNAIIGQTTDDGIPVSPTGKMILVVPPALRKLAQQLTQSELVADSGNNAVNVYRGPDFDMLEVVWLSAANGGSDTAWFLISPEQAKLMFIERLSPSFDMSIDNNTKNRSYDVLARWSVGYADWRFVWGSAGDLATYSS